MKGFHLEVSIIFFVRFKISKQFQIFNRQFRDRSVYIRCNFSAIQERMSASDY